MNTVEDWYEVSDTVRTQGSSKATIVLQKTQVFQRAIFFSLLNPLPGGACFAGMKVRKEDFDFSEYSGLLMQCRAQSTYFTFLKPKKVRASNILRLS